MRAGREAQETRHVAARGQERARDVRPDDGAPVRERGVRDRELERRHLEQALADREVHRLARVPVGLRRLEALQIGGPRDDPAPLRRQVDPGRMAQPEQVGPALHVEAARLLLPEVEPIPQSVEPRVARDGERLREFERRVHARIDVEERRVPDQVGRRARKARVRGDEPRRERGLGDDRLERRAGRIDPLRRPVQERRRGVVRVDEVREVARVLRGRDLVEGRVAREREQRARLRVDRHRGARGGVVVAVRAGEGDPVPDRLLGDALEPGVDRELEAAPRRDDVQRAERPHGPAERIDGDAVPLQPAVQPPVVGGLDARLADDLARLAAGVTPVVELAGVDLAVQAEELASEGSLRVAPRRDRGDVEAGEGPGPLVEELRERLLEVRDHDRRRVRRAQHAATDPADEEAGRLSGQPGGAREELSAAGRRAPAAVGVDPSERVGVGRQDELALRAGEQAPVRVEDRRTRGGQVDVAERLPRGLMGVARPLEDLQRPQAEREQTEDRDRDRGEDAHADVEAAAAEEAGVRGGDRLGHRAHARQRPGQAHGAPLAAGGRDEATHAFRAVVERAQFDLGSTSCPGPGCSTKHAEMVVRAVSSGTSRYARAHTGFGEELVHPAAGSAGRARRSGLLRGRPPLARGGCGKSDRRRGLPESARSLYARGTRLRPGALAGRSRAGHGHHPGRVGRGNPGAGAPRGPRAARASTAVLLRPAARAVDTRGRMAV